MATRDNLTFSDAGSALIELALMVGLLGVPLLLGTGEIAPLVYDSAEITNAAHAGALYGMQSTVFAADSVGIIAATQADVPDLAYNLTVVPITYFACATNIGGTQYTGVNALITAQLSCIGTNNHPVQFVQVTTSLTVNPTIKCPGLPSNFQLSGKSVMEVEQ